MRLRGGGVRVQSVVTSRGALGQPFEGSIATTAPALRGARRSGLYFSVPNSLRFGARRAVLQRGSDGDGVARGRVEAFFDDDRLSLPPCRERCTCVREHRPLMPGEMSCRSFAEFKAHFYRTECERVASRRGKSVQRTAKRFCGDLGGRRAYILNRE